MNTRSPKQRGGRLLASAQKRGNYFKTAVLFCFNSYLGSPQVQFWGGLQYLLSERWVFHPIFPLRRSSGAERARWQAVLDQAEKAPVGVGVEPAPAAANRPEVPSDRDGEAAGSATEAGQAGGARVRVTPGEKAFQKLRREYVDMEQALTDAYACVLVQEGEKGNEMRAK